MLIPCLSSLLPKKAFGKRVTTRREPWRGGQGGGPSRPSETRSVSRGAAGQRPNDKPGKIPRTGFREFAEGWALCSKGGFFAAKRWSFLPRRSEGAKKGEGLRKKGRGLGLSALSIRHGGGILREKGGRLRLGRVSVATDVLPTAANVLPTATNVLPAGTNVLPAATNVLSDVLNILQWLNDFHQFTNKLTQTSKYHTKLRTIQN